MNPSRTPPNPVWAEIMALRAEVSALRAELATVKAELAAFKVELSELKTKIEEVNKEMKVLTAISNRVTGGAILIVTLGGIIGGIATLSNVVINAVKLWLKGS